jgi:phenylpropionate dioxygenase-like ring-hydroxylating dioxygenase large terminal subunit
VVPSLEAGAKPPARAKVDSYPVQEQYGIVFAFLGDLPEEQRPPLFEIEEYEDEAWRASEIMILEIDCFYQRSMENGVDPVHNEFVHPIQGSPQPIPGSIEYPETAWGSGVTGKYTEKGSKESDADGMRSDPNVLNAGTWHYGPNTLITWINFAKNTGLHQYMFEAPVDGDHTKIYFINMRSFRLGSEHDDRIREANLRVTVEDIVILENLYPVRTPETRTKEILTPSDKAVVRYRDFLEDWNAQDRRNTGNWVLDPVPLMPAARKGLSSAA